MPRRCVPDLFSWGHFRRGHRQDFCLHVFFTITVVPEARVTTVWTQAIAAELHVTSQYTSRRMEEYGNGQLIQAMCLFKVEHVAR